MFKEFFPYECAGSVFEIDYRKLYKKGIRGIIFDIDNTLVHHGDDSTPEIERLFRDIHDAGLKTLLLTNNDEERVERFIKNIDTLYICDAEKPEPEGYRKALKKLKLKKSQAVCVGDQIFTDILGANKAGIPSILVKYIMLPGETKIGKRRYAEKLILWYYRHTRYAHRLGDIIMRGGSSNAVE